MSTLDSGAVVESIWHAFAAGFERQYEVSLSKKSASANFLEGDPDLLGRWTKPGKHKNWRIPLWRVDAFCEAFKATSEQRDELMMARLQELRDDNDGRPTSEWVAAEWGAQLAAPERLTSDEREVLNAWRKQAQKWPRGLYGTPEERARLEGAFGTLLKDAERLATEEDAGTTLSEEEEERLREGWRRHADDLRLRQEGGTRARRQERQRLPKAAYRDKYLKKLLGKSKPPAPLVAVQPVDPAG